MHRTIAVSAFAAALFATLPAFAQEVPELAGAPPAVFPKAPPPPPLKTPAPAPKTTAKPAAKPAPVSPSPKPAKSSAQAQQDAADKLEAEQAKLEQQADAEAQQLLARQQAEQQQAQQQQAKAKQVAADRLKTDQAKLDQQASAQKAEQARLAKLSAGLTARETELARRAAELDAQEQRLAQLKQQQESKSKTQLATADRRDTPPALKVEDDAVDEDDAVIGGGPADLPPPAADLPSRDLRARVPTFARLDYDAALQQCRRAGEDAAYARRFDSAEYDGEPRVFNNEGWELRGRMRLEDRRGYVTVNTVCEVDADGEVRHFALLR